MTLSTKAAWRAHAKRVRTTLDTAALSQAVVAALRQSPLYQNARHVLSYAAFGDELSLSALLGDDKQFYLTRTQLAPEPRLSIHPYDPKRLVRHPYGFDEPAPDAPEVAPEVLELVLAPGLAFDRRGVRLGYGKGLYDRLLAHLSPTVPRVGVVAEALIAEVLPHEQHDVRMTHLASERGVVAV
jgi:5-formyltetrahydrofolate cyclo-ligase